MAMTFGIHVGHLGGPMDELRKLWRFADAAGFDWTSVADHFQESPPQGGDGDCFEAIASYTAMAMETKRVRLGALVFCVNYRNPGLLAKSLCTIDHLSGGRVECGIGAGWHEAEYRGFGIPFERIGVREDQLEEAVQILRMLFDQKVSNFDGKHFKLVDARCNPKPLQPRLRIWIGGQGEKRTLRAAAKYADGWNAPYIDPKVWAAKNAVLDEWCAKEGRDPDEHPPRGQRGLLSRRGRPGRAARGGALPEALGPEQPARRASSAARPRTSSRCARPIRRRGCSG